MRSDATRAAGNAFVLVLAGVCALQCALAAGAPLGFLAWGHAGGDGALNPRLRLASAAAALALGALASLVRRQGVLGVQVIPFGLFRGLMWVLAVELALNTLGNLASSSPPERWIMAPVSLLGGLLAARIAQGQARPSPDQDGARPR